MLKQRFGKLNSEDLMRWRVIRARQRGIEARPSNYSRAEIEAAFHDEWRLLAEFTETYAIPDGTEVAIYTDTGLIEEAGE